MNALLCTGAAVLLSGAAAVSADQTQGANNNHTPDQTANANDRRTPDATAGTTPQSNDANQTKDWPITLHRPVQVGHTTRIRAEGSERRSITGVVAGVSQKFDEHEIAVNFDAEAQVLAVDAVGRPISMQYTVHTCTMTMNGKAYIIAEPETVITATRAGDATRFEIDGEPLDDNAAAALDIVAALDTGGPTADEVFGTDHRQHVGDEWPVNSEAAMEAYNVDDQAEVSAGDITGRSTLLATKNCNGQDCLMISSRLTLQNSVPGLDDLPKQFNVHRAFTTVMRQSVLPADHDLQPVQDSLNMDLEAVLIGSLGPDQPETVLHLSGTRAAARTFEVIESDTKVSSISR